MPFQILSLSGGGYRGLYSAAVLADLEGRFRTTAASHFDLFAGTSIGGISALALAADIPATRVRDAFKDNGKAIFGTKEPPRTRFGILADVLSKALSCKYKADALRSTIEDILGADTRIGDLRHPVIVPTVNLTVGRPSVFKTPHHPSLCMDANRLLVEVALATSAAPTFFPLAEVNGSYHADGGLFANSPDLMAVHEAIHFLGQNEADLTLLSIGTTSSNFSIANPSKPDFGIINWFSGNRLLNVMIAAQERSVDYMMQHRLADRYLRVDENQSSEQEGRLALDCASDTATKTILGLAGSSSRRAVGLPFIRDVFRHAARAQTFYDNGEPKNG